MKKTLEEVKRALKNAKTALVVSHIDPDGDSIGSMLVLGLLLEKLGLSTMLYCEDDVPKIYRFLYGADEVRKTLTLSKHFDIAFAADASDLNRLGSNLNLRDAAKVIVNIDHHPDNVLFGDINYVSKKSSTAELIYNLCKFLKVKIDKRMAECLYVALITDTGNFRYENTSGETFVMAADLLHAGVNTHELTTRIYDTKTIASLRIVSAALMNLEISPDRKAAWAVVTEEMMQKAGARGEDLIGLVDQIRSIEGIEVAVLFREERGKVKINFRSKEKINVSEIAENFGGGGHTRAAGAVVAGGVETVKQKVIAEVLKYLKASRFLV